MQEVKIKETIDYFKKIEPRACAVKKSGTVDPKNGLDCIFVDDRDIKALKEEKTLYFSDGEYAHLIVYKGD